MVYKLLQEYGLTTLILMPATHAVSLPEPSKQVLELQPRENSGNCEEAADTLALFLPCLPALALATDAPVNCLEHGGMLFM